MTDAHRHLGHEVVTVVQHQSEQGPLLWRGQQPEQRCQGISQGVEAEIRSSGPHVADHVTATVFEPVLQPVGDDLGLNVEFVVVLVFAVLLRGPSPKHLHRFAGHPVVLQQELPQVMGPLPA